MTAFVAGDGAYSLVAGSARPVNTNGASLVVFFNDGLAANNRDVVMFDGNDSNINNSFDAPGWNVSLPGINCTSGSAAMQMHVADGQEFRRRCAHPQRQHARGGRSHFPGRLGAGRQ